VTVLGGRVAGIGVAGFTLGGGTFHTRAGIQRPDQFAGYSWFSNQYGLTIDTVQAFEVVLPNGTIATVSDTAYPDLFFGLKVCLSRHSLSY
jgi:FAD/FMN-containing dehydrogenase